MAINAGTIVAQMELNAKNFKQGISETKKSLTDLSNDTTSAGNKVKALSQGMSSAGKTMTMGLTLPLAAAGGAAVKTTADFEKAMSEVQAIAGITDKSSKAFKDMEAAAKDLGATTAFSAGEAAEGMKYLAMAGMDSNQIIDAMPGLLDLAAASGTDLGTTADIVSDSLTAFGLSASDTGHFADVLAVASSSANVSVETLGETFKYAAPVAGSLGFKMEEVTAAASLMGNASIKASQAGTTLRTAMTNMGIAADANNSVFKELGIELKNQDGSMKSFGDILGQTKKKFDTMTEAQKASYAEALFGKNAMSGMLAVLNSSDGALEELTKQFENADGASKKMVDTMLDNLNGQLTLLKTGLKGAAISIGTALMPAIKWLVGAIQNWVTWFNNLSPTMQRVIVVIGVIVAAIGPLLLIIAKVITVVQTLMALGPALGAIFTALTGPIGLVVAAIAAVIAIGVLLYKNWDTVKEYAGKLWESIKDIFGKIGDWIEGIWESIKKATAAAWEWIKDNLDTILKAIFVIITGTVGAIALFIYENWDKIKEVTVKVWEAIKDFFKKVWDAIIEAVKWYLETYINTVKTIFNAIKTFITNVLNSIKTIITNIFNGIKNTINSIFNGIKSIIVSIWNSIKNSIRTALNGIRNVITGYGGKLKGAGREIFNKVWDGIKDVWGNIKGWVGDKVSWLKDKLTFWKKSKDKMKDDDVGHNAKGTYDWRGGLTWVGENGPELVSLPKHSKIYPHTQSVDMAQQAAASSAAPVENHFHFGNVIADKSGLRKLERMLSEVRLNETVRTGG